SDVIRTGKLGSATVAFVARHGFDHRHLPSELPQRANFWALKSMGVQRVLGVSAVGGLQEACSPGTAVVPDQIIDRTRGVRPPSFFGEGVVAHVAMADPFCPVLRKAVVGALKATDGKTIDTGTYVVIEGPSF